MVMSFQRSISRLSQICVYKYLGVSLSLASLASSYKEKKKQTWKHKQETEGTEEIRNTWKRSAKLVQVTMDLGHFQVCLEHKS